jgi:hypothetical protein
VEVETEVVSLTEVTTGVVKVVISMVDVDLIVLDLSVEVVVVVLDRVWSVVLVLTAVEVTT